MPELRPDRPHPKQYGYADPSYTEEQRKAIIAEFHRRGGDSSITTVEELEDFFDKKSHAEYPADEESAPPTFWHH